MIYCSFAFRNAFAVLLTVPTLGFFNQAQADENLCAKLS